MIYTNDTTRAVVQIIGGILKITFIIISVPVLFLYTFMIGIVKDQPKGRGR